MMIQIVLSTKNITKINIILFYIFISVITSQEYAAYDIDKKQKNLDRLDSEIISLENKLKTEMNSSVDAGEKINLIEDALKKERVQISKKRYQKEEKETLLYKVNFILDSLKQELTKINIKKQDVKEIIDRLNITKKELNYKIKIINDSINIINEKISNTSRKLDQIEKKTKNLITESLPLTTPSEIEFMLESDNWDMFIINKNLYQLLIEDQKNSFDSLINQYENINSILIQDSLNIEKLNDDKNILDFKLKEYGMQLKNFMEYKVKLNTIIDEKNQFANALEQEYSNIELELDDSKNKILTLEGDLDLLNKKNTSSIEEQQKIKSQIIIKEKARKSIRNEILKLIERSKKIEGVDIKKLKGKLPWPIDGKLITKFGKHTNPDTKVIIDYDLIELQPFMTNEEKIIYLAKQINPNNPNKSIVQEFQSKSMNLKKGDRGYGVFGPQTTKMWKKYSKKSLDLSEQPIFSIYKGEVESINFINPIVGVVIIIRHDNDYFSVYNGNIEALVMEGSKVSTNQKIGSIKKQNILTFQLWKNNNPVNPENWFIKK